MVKQENMNNPELKFKVGDVITDGKDKVTVTGISSEGYNITSEEIEVCESYVGIGWYIDFNDQDKWELI